MQDPPFIQAIFRAVRDKFPSAPSSTVTNFARDYARPFPKKLFCFIGDRTNPSNDIDPAVQTFERQFSEQIQAQQSQRHEARRPESQGHESQGHEARRHEARRPESQGHEARRHEPRRHESQGHEARRHESERPESERPTLFKMMIWHNRKHLEKDERSVRQFATEYCNGIDPKINESYTETDLFKAIAALRSNFSCPPPYIPDSLREVFLQDLRELGLQKVLARNPEMYQKFLDSNIHHDLCFLVTQKLDDPILKDIQSALCTPTIGVLLASLEVHFDPLSMIPTNISFFVQKLSKQYQPTRGTVKIVVVSMYGRPKEQVSEGEAETMEKWRKQFSDDLIGGSSACYNQFGEKAHLPGVAEAQHEMPASKKQQKFIPLWRNSIIPTISEHTDMRIIQTMTDGGADFLRFFPSATNPSSPATLEELSNL
jgi:hypothetical protein